MQKVPLLAASMVAKSVASKEILWDEKWVEPKG